MGSQAFDELSTTPAFVLVMKCSSFSLELRSLSRHSPCPGDINIRCGRRAWRYRSRATRREQQSANQRSFADSVFSAMPCRRFTDAKRDDHTRRHGVAPASPLGKIRATPIMPPEAHYDMLIIKAIMKAATTLACSPCHRR